MGRRNAIRMPALPLTLALALTVAAAIGFYLAPSHPQSFPARDGPPLTEARSWGYQLQNIDPDALDPALDLLVVDFSRDGSRARALSHRDLLALRTRPGGRPRIVLAYVSIGEAENYRDYWRPEWAARPPVWLGRENSAWNGNFAVQYWHAAWQRLILAPEPASMTLGERIQALWGGVAPGTLDAVIAAGFDGVYFDRVDAFETAAAVHPTARADMIAFVSKLSMAAKTRRPGFLVVAQNGEALLDDPAYVRALDGVAKEDLLYGETGDGLANAPDSTRRAIGYLQRAKAGGLPVFTVEYVGDPDRQRAAMADWATLGFVGTFANRALSTPPVVPSLNGMGR